MATQDLFSQSLAKCQLLSLEELKAIEGEIGGIVDSTDRAKRLVTSGRITTWQAQQLLAGKHTLVLGRYRLLDKLGEGGMGAVYKAEHSTTHRMVAIKLMSESVANQPGAAARFQREIRAASALAHPNIVAALDADQIGGLHFLVMEFAPGRDLKEWIQEFGRLPVDWSCECIRQAAVGLEHARERGLAHRDIKPSNLLVLEDPSGGPPRVKILDMGLARFTSEVQCTVLTQTGQCLGTIDYIAPEQARDTKGAGIQADIFSLGASLFHLLTGQVPFQGKSMMEKLMARAMRDAPRARSLRPDIPAALDDVVARMLARNPGDRYPTPAEVAAALAPFSLAAAGDRTGALVLPKTSGPGSTIEPRADHTLDGFLAQLGAEDDAMAIGKLETDRLPRVEPAVRESTRVEEAEPAFAISVEASAPSRGSSYSAPAGDRKKAAALAASGVAALLAVVVAWLVLRGNENVKPQAKGKPPVREAGPLSAEPLGGDQNARPQPAELATLIRELKRLNPGYDGTLAWKGDERQVTSLELTNRNLTSIAPLKALKGLTSLNVNSNQIDDLTPLAELPLRELHISYTRVTKLDALAGMKLETLGWRDSSQVCDLTPLKGMPLVYLHAGPCIPSLAPLEGMKLRLFSTVHPTFTDVERLRGMPLEELTVEFPAEIESLEILRGMPLRYLHIVARGALDLEALREAPLKTLNVYAPKVKSIEPLAGKKLESLTLYDLQVTSLAPLAGAPLTAFTLHAPVKDLSPLVGSPLTQFFFEDLVVERDLPVLKRITTLQSINHVAPDAFYAHSEIPNPPLDGAGFTPLFDGVSLAGWQGDQPFWSVKDGVLTAKGDAAPWAPPSPEGYSLWSKETYGNYQLKFRFRSRSGNSGLILHGPLQGEIDMNHTAEGPPRLGAFLYQGQPRGSHAQAYRKDDWNDVSVLADGARIRVTLNGQVTFDSIDSVFLDNDKPARGKIGIQLPNPETHVEFAQIELCPLHDRVQGGVPQSLAPLYKVFEDEPDFAGKFDQSMGATLAGDLEAYSGTMALRCTPTWIYRDYLPGLGVNVREKPKPGEFRYLRFAWKKTGGEQIGLQFREVKGGQNAHRFYYAGALSDDIRACPAKLVAVTPPVEWTVVTRDLFADFGEFELNGLAIVPRDGQYALYDHIYLSRSLADFEGCPAPRAPSEVKPDADGYTPLFDGQSLAGWTGNTAHWSVVDGAIVGTGPLQKDPPESLLESTRSFANFSLRLKFRFDKGNSGVVLRRVWEVNLSAEPGTGLMGTVEKRRPGVREEKKGQEGARTVLRPLPEWNDLEIVADGPKVTSSLNGVRISELVDEDPQASRSGPVALQLWHAFQTKVEFKDVRIKEIASSVAPVDLGRGLIAHWKFDEADGDAIKDSSGNGRDATLVGAKRVPGKLGRALDFDGREGHAEFRKLTTTDSFTYALWMKPRTLKYEGEPYSGLLMNNGWSPQAVHLQMNTNRPWLGILGPTADPNELATTIRIAREDLNRWFHLVAILDAEKGRVWYFGNGRAAGEIVAEKGKASLGPGLIGAYRDEAGMSRRYDGLIDDVRIYDRVLSPDEIATLYKLGNASEQPPP